MRRSTHCAAVHAHTDAHTHIHKIMQPPQIILSNSSLTPAVREHFPRVRSYNQTLGEISQPGKLNSQKDIFLSHPRSPALSFPKRPKVLRHLLATLENTFSPT